MRGGAKQLMPVILPLFEELGTKEDASLKQQLQTTLNVFLPLLTPRVRDRFIPQFENKITKGGVHHSEMFCEFYCRCSWVPAKLLMQNS